MIELIVVGILKEVGFSYGVEGLWCDKLRSLRQMTVPKIIGVTLYCDSGLRSPPPLKVMVRVVGYSQFVVRDEIFLRAVQSTTINGGGY